MYARPNPSAAALPLEPIPRPPAAAHYHDDDDADADADARRRSSAHGDDDDDSDDLELSLGEPIPAWKSAPASAAAGGGGTTSSSKKSRRHSPLRRAAHRLRQHWVTALLAALALLVLANIVLGDGSNIGRTVAGYVKSHQVAGEPYVAPTDLHYDSPFNRDDLTLTEGECDVLFPGLWKDLERARAYYARLGNRFTRSALELSCADKDFSQLRVVVYHNRLYVKMYKQSDQSRTQSTLSLLQQSIMSSRERLPNVEFCLDLQDWGHSGMFSLSRSPDQQDVWLMPDYAFFAWPEHIGGSYKEFREKSAELEKQIGWEGKVNKLFWRGSIHVGTEDRQALLDAATGHGWSDVQVLDWTGDRHEWVSMIDHCKWKFHGFPEGNTYSGRLRYLQHCRSVIVTHEPHWIQHWTHLYNANMSSPDQNIVFVPKVDRRNSKLSSYAESWTRLPEVMDDLLKNDDKARRIADNQWTFFRERYVSPASAACYWRKALKMFASVQAYDVDLTGREIAFEDHMINGFPAWPPAS